MLDSFNLTGTPGYLNDVRYRSENTLFKPWKRGHTYLCKECLIKMDKAEEFKRKKSLIRCTGCDRELVCVDFPNNELPRVVIKEKCKSAKHVQRKDRHRHE